MANLTVRAWSNTDPHREEQEVVRGDQFVTARLTTSDGHDIRIALVDPQHPAGGHGPLFTIRIALFKSDAQVSYEDFPYPETKADLFQMFAKMGQRKL